MPGIWFIAALMCCSVVMYIAGRYARRGRAVVCRGCEFDLAGLQNAAVCPECGRSLESKRAIAHGHSLPWLRRVGTLVLLLTLGVVAYQATSKPAWDPYKPLWLLGIDIRLGGTAQSDRFAQEVARRARLIADGTSDQNGSDLAGVIAIGVAEGQAAVTWFELAEQAIEWGWASDDHRETFARGAVKRLMSADTAEVMQLDSAIISLAAFLRLNSYDLNELLRDLAGERARSRSADALLGAIAAGCIVSDPDAADPELVTALIQYTISLEARPIVSGPLLRYEVTAEIDTPLQHSQLDLEVQAYDVLLDGERLPQPGLSSWYSQLLRINGPRHFWRSFSTNGNGWGRRGSAPVLVDRVPAGSYSIAFLADVSLRAGDTYLGTLESGLELISEFTRVKDPAESVRLVAPGESYGNTKSPTPEQARKLLYLDTFSYQQDFAERDWQPWRLTLDYAQQGSGPNSWSSYNGRRSPSYPPIAAKVEIVQDQAVIATGEIIVFQNGDPVQDEHRARPRGTFSLGSVTWDRGWTPPDLDAPVSVRLTPSIRAAERAIDLREIWGGSVESGLHAIPVVDQMNQQAPREIPFGGPPIQSDGE